MVLGPEHDWSSNAADAFGYRAIAYEEPPVKSMTIRRSPQPRARSPFTPGHHQASESSFRQINKKTRKMRRGALGRRRMLFGPIECKH